MWFARQRGGKHASLVRDHDPDGRDERYLNTHVLPRFGEVPLTKIQNAGVGFVS